MQQQARDSQTATQGLCGATRTPQPAQTTSRPSIYTQPLSKTHFRLMTRPQPLPLMTRRSKRQAKLSCAFQSASARACSSAAGAAA